MSISVGERLPKTTLVKATPDGPQPVDSEEFFRGRRVAIFSVPGAFTPTCSARHLPGFVERADEITWKSLRNVERVHLLVADQLNTYDVLVSDDVVFTQGALDAFLAGPATGRSVTAVATESEAALEEDTK